MPYTRMYPFEDVVKLVNTEFPEPYNIWTYTRFLTNWPHLCFVVRTKQAYRDSDIVGTVVGRIDGEDQGEKHGYIGMLAVDQHNRRKGIGRQLMQAAIAAFTSSGASEITLDTESTNVASQALYQSLGFLYTETLSSHYSDGTDAYRLVLRLPSER